MSDPCLADLLENTKDGEWGQGTASDDTETMLVIRGTDFADVRVGNLSSVPIRHIPQRIANRKALREGDLLIETAGGTKDQPTGRTVLLKEAVFANARYRITCASFSRFLRVDRNLVRPDYLFWFLQNLYMQGDMYPYHVQHTGVARFQYTQFASSQRIPLPSSDEQEAIATTLNFLDDKIEINRQMNETLEATARLFFKDWFVDFGPTRAKAEGRQPYLAPELWTLFPDALDDDDKPMGWEEKPLSSLIELTGGGTPKTSVAEYWNGSIPWFSVVDAPAPSDTFVIKTEKTITHSGLEGSSTRLIPRNATIITARGTVGKLALVGLEMAMNQSCYAITGKAGWSNYFIHFILKNAVQTLQANTHGSVFDTITRATFDTVSSCCPTQNIAIAFDETIRGLMEQIRSNLFENETLAQTRDLLLPKLMSGEIRLRDAEKLVEQVA